MNTMGMTWLPEGWTVPLALKVTINFAAAFRSTVNIVAGIGPNAPPGLE
jgi:hypothetical protein